MAVGAAGRVRRADREHADHQPDGGGPAQAVRGPAARPERRRRHHRGPDGAAPGGARACRAVPRGRAGAEAPGGRLPRGGRLADVAVEDAGAADHARHHVLDAHRRRRPGAVRRGRHPALRAARPGGDRPGRAARPQRRQPARRGVRGGTLPGAARALPDVPPRRRRPARRGRRVRHLRRPRPAGTGSDRDLDGSAGLGHLHGREARPRRRDPADGQPPCQPARRDRGPRPRVRRLRPDHPPRTLLPPAAS